MTNTIALAATFLLSGSNLTSEEPPHAFCPHEPLSLPPQGCTGEEELSAYERGYRNGVFIVDYAFDLYGDCSRWDEVESLIDELKASVGNLAGTDPVDYCRLGGMSDAISDREAELGDVGCCGTIAGCPDHGDHDGPQYAGTYCMMAVKSETCFDPSKYTRGPAPRSCGDEFEKHCSDQFTLTARDDPDCSKYTDDAPLQECLAPFLSYRDSICASSLE